MPRIHVDRIRAAFEVIDPVFLHTPQFECEPLSDALGCRLTVKVETQNPIRSFKGRGAETYMAALVASGEKGPVVCASAGNFGQAIAYAGRRRDIPVVVYAAENANPLKIERMRGLGAEVRLHGADFDAAKDASRAFAEAEGLRLAVDSLDVETAEGAGTMGMELLSLDPLPEVMLVPLGNGAMINGIATALKAHAPQIQVVAVQAEQAPAMVDSWRAGEVVVADSADTIADGIGVRVPVAEALDDMKGIVDDAVLISEASMIDAMRLLHRHLGLVVEPSGVAAVSALMQHRDRFAGQRAATILCGGNLTPEQMATWLRD
ncbi:MAG: threonine/serine dehydratase [Pseudomonadota bacterium]